MAINKVIYGTSTLIDLTADTVAVDTLGKDTTAHDKSGTEIIGTLESGGSTGGGSETWVLNESFNIIEISDQVFSCSFKSNNASYSSLTVSGGKTVLKYDNTSIYTVSGGVDERSLP